MARSALAVLTRMVSKGVAQLQLSDVPRHFIAPLGERPGSRAHVLCDTGGRQAWHGERGGIVFVHEYGLFCLSGKFELVFRLRVVLLLELHQTKLE